MGGQGPAACLSGQLGGHGAHKSNSRAEVHSLRLVAMLKS